MAPKILESVNFKAGGFTVLQSLGIAGLKIISERALSKTFVGNASVKSGLWKMGGALALGFASGDKEHMLAKLGRMEATALMVDAGEDIVGSVMRKYSVMQGEDAQQEIGTSNQGAQVVSAI